MFEHFRQPLLPGRLFVRRMLMSVVFSFALISVTLFIGAAVFRLTEKFSWIDAFLNAVMIMTGVGLVGNVTSTWGKVLTGVYSLASTLIFFTVLAIIFTPLLHRLMHKFHMDLDRKR
jgi:predicted tellurium resistance membrane protein TerC